MKNFKDYPLMNNDRINFSKISGKLPLPYLCEIQTESFKSFLDYGIKEVFQDVFPIENYAKNMSINYVSHEISLPKFSALQCKEKDLTYSASLNVKLALTDSNKDGQIVESDVFMGEIPLMTDSGTSLLTELKESLFLKLFVLLVLTYQKPLTQKMVNGFLMPI